MICVTAPPGPSWKKIAFSLDIKALLRSLFRIKKKNKKPGYDKPSKYYIITRNTGKRFFPLRTMM